LNTFFQLFVTLLRPQTSIIMPEVRYCAERTPTGFSAQE
jgi:hypothetical protein